MNKNSDPEQDQSGQSITQKMTELRLREQMISCMDYVVEKTRELDSSDPILSQLQTIMDVLDSKHAFLAASIAEWKKTK